MVLRLLEYTTYTTNKAEIRIKFELNKTQKTRICNRVKLSIIPNTIRKTTTIFFFVRKNTDYNLTRTNCLAHPTTHSYRPSEKACMHDLWRSLTTFLEEAVLNRQDVPETTTLYKEIKDFQCHQ